MRRRVVTLVKLEVINLDKEHDALMREPSVKTEPSSSYAE